MMFSNAEKMGKKGIVKRDSDSTEKVEQTLITKRPIKKSVSFGSCTTRYIFLAETGEPDDHHHCNQPSYNLCCTNHQIDGTSSAVLEQIINRSLRHVPLGLVTSSPLNELLLRRLLSQAATFHNWTFLGAFQTSPPVNVDYNNTFCNVQGLFAGVTSLDYDTFSRQLYRQLDMNLELDNFRFDLFRPLLFSGKFSSLVRRPITIWGGRSPAMEGTLGEMLFGGLAAVSSSLPVAASPLFFSLSVKVLESFYHEIAYLRQHFRLAVQPALWFEYFLLVHSHAPAIGTFWRTGSECQLKASFGHRLATYLRLLSNIEEELLGRLIDEQISLIGEALRLPVVRKVKAGASGKGWSQRKLYPLEMDWNMFLHNFYFTVTAVRDDANKQP